MKSLLEEIYASSLNFLFPHSLKKTAVIIVEEAVKLVDADYGSIFIASRGRLARVYSSVPSRFQIMPRKDGFTYRSFKTGKVFILTRKKFLKTHPEHNLSHTKSIIIIPLFNRNKSFGVLTLQSRKREHFTRGKTTALRLFGSMASLAIRRSQLLHKMKEVLHTRDLFISLASHELKTPITVIYGYTQILHKALLEKKLPDIALAETLKKETYRLILLTHELLQLDQIKKGVWKYTFRQCSVRQLVNRAAINFKVVNLKNELIVENMPKNIHYVRGDFDKLLQVVTNILNNAVKFSPIGSPVNLSVKNSPRFTTIIIKDKGKGILKKELPKVFNGFYKGDNASSAGMGLGLFLSKAIVDEHNGDLQISSRLGKGTTVRIKLPQAS